MTSHEQPSIDKLREHLRTLLPHYMIPQNFVVLDAMPLTDNGKVNVKALPAPESQSNATAPAACTTPAEKYLETLWKNALQLDSISRNDNFFDVGGHSLLVMHIINEAEAFTRIRLSPQEFLLGTLEQLAAQLDECDAFANLETKIDHAGQFPASEAHTPIPLPSPASPATTALQAETKSKSPFDCLKRFWS